jgi:hypothetical protein
MRLIAPMLACLMLGNVAALAQTGVLPSAAPSSGAAKSTAKSPGVAAGKNAVNDEYADCMQLWDKGTHMTKQEWSRTCRRVQNRLNQVQMK